MILKTQRIKNSLILSQKRFARDKKGDVGTTLTWVPAVVIIVVIMGLYVLGVGGIATKNIFTFEFWLKPSSNTNIYTYDQAYNYMFAQFDANYYLLKFLNQPYNSTYPTVYSYLSQWQPGKDTEGYEKFKAMAEDFMQNQMISPNPLEFGNCEIAIYVDGMSSKENQIWITKIVPSSKLYFSNSVNLGQRNIIIKLIVEISTK